MKRLSVKAIKALCILLPLCFAGCTQANNTPVLPGINTSGENNTSEEKPVTLSCSYKVSSEVNQKNLGTAASDSTLSRSATASIPTGITYFVTAETSDGSRTVNVPSSDIDTIHRSFTISLVTGYTWKITVGIKNSAGKEILSDSVTKSLTPNDTLMAPTFKLKPHITAGKTGDLLLNVSCPSGYSLSVSDETSTTWNVTPDPVVANKYQVTASNVASGTYNLILTFTKSGVPPFITSQVVTIYDNLETNSWHSGGNDLITDGNFELTTAIANIAAENRKDFYVDGTAGGPGNDNNSGNYQAPLATISKAFGLINAVGLDNNSIVYKIHIKNGTSETISTGIDVTKNILVDCYATTPGDKAGTATLTASTGATYIFNVTSKNLYLYGLNLDGNNVSDIIGIYANSTSTDSAYVLIGSGSIKHCCNGLYLDGNLTNVYLRGGEITDNVNTSSRIGAGISINNGSIAYLYLEGSPKVIGNMADDGSPQNFYLPTGNRIDFTGALTTGAQIGITTQTPPTLSTPAEFTRHYTTKHGTTHPSAYFVGDVYGVSQNAAGEATLNLSGGSLTQQFYDNITLSCAKSTSPNTTITSDSVSKATGLPRTYQFKVLASDGTDLTSTNINDFSLISFKNQGSNYGSDYAEQQTGTNKNKVQLKAACLPGTYYLTMGFTYLGTTYTSTLRVVVTD